VRQCHTGAVTLYSIITSLRDQASVATAGLRPGPALRPEA
jgi:hypothetical protein